MTEKNKTTLAAALVAAQAEMDNATMNSINPHFRSRYADLAAVRAATLPALNKHGLSLLQYFIPDTNGGVVLRTRLLHETGEFIDSAYPIALDKPQAMGSAITYGRRYCWAAMCGIAAEEDDDANEAQKTSALKTTTTKPKAESRDDYSDLTNGIRACETQKELQAWGVTNRTAIELLPDSWQKNLRDEYARHYESLVE